MALTTVFVDTGALDTVTMTVAEAPPKVPVAAYDALIEFAPEARLEPLTVTVALAELPVTINAADPRVILPKVNVTAPEGAFEPVTGVTFAISCVVPLAAMDAGLAVKVIAVPVTGGRLCQLTTKL